MREVVFELRHQQFRALRLLAATRHDCRGRGRRRRHGSFCRRIVLKRAPSTVGRLHLRNDALQLPPGVLGSDLKVSGLALGVPGPHLGLHRALLQRRQPVVALLERGPQVFDLPTLVCQCRLERLDLALDVLELGKRDVQLLLLCVEIVLQVDDLFVLRRQLGARQFDLPAQPSALGRQVPGLQRQCPGLGKLLSQVPHVVLPALQEPGKRVGTLRLGVQVLHRLLELPGLGSQGLVGPLRRLHRVDLQLLRLARSNRRLVGPLARRVQLVGEFRRARLKPGAGSLRLGLERLECLFGVLHLDVARRQPPLGILQRGPQRVHLRAHLADRRLLPLQLHLEPLDPVLEQGVGAQRRVPPRLHLVSTDTHRRHLPRGFL